MRIIDVRDLAVLAVRCMEQHRPEGPRYATSAPHSACDAVSGVGRYTIDSILEACRRAAQSDATLTWVPARVLDEWKVEGSSGTPA